MIRTVAARRVAPGGRGATGTSGGGGASAGAAPKAPAARAEVTARSRRRFTGRRGPMEASGAGSPAERWGNDGDFLWHRFISKNYRFGKGRIPNNRVAQGPAGSHLGHTGPPL